LIRGGVGVLPTDTLYGLVGQAYSRKTVKRIYSLKKRSSKRPFIILISSVKDIGSFGIKLDKKTRVMLSAIWPGKVSVILPGSSKRFYYLHGGKNSLAFRLPRKASLIRLLKMTGPLAAPSANPEGKRPAESINEAREYFGKNIDFYLGDGRIKSLPSTLFEIKADKVRVKRKGSVKISFKKLK